MTEVSLFIIMSFVAIATAVMMLLSENAVYSALFLIINFTSVAFLYLMLNAPFLAMVQIAVYAGAIMVLFLFVIMLLGAEKTTDTTWKYPWFTLAALFLAVVFLLTAGLALVGGQIELTQPVEGTPVLRVAHVAPDSKPLDVFVDGELLAENLAFRETTDFTPMEPGDYTLTFSPTGSGVGSAIATLPVTLESAPDSEASAYTVVVYGESLAPLVGLVETDLGTVGRRSTRLDVFNAFTGAASVSVVDLGTNRRLDTDSETGEITDKVVVSDLEPGSVSEPFVHKQGLTSLAFLSPEDETLYTMREYTLEKETSQLIILTGERLFDNSLRAVAVPLVTGTTPSFGGPRSVGEILFSRYLLPFEMVAVLLLAAMIGAIVLTHGEDYQPRRRPARRKVSRPLTSVVAAQTGHTLSSAPETAPESEAAESEHQPEPVGD
jgi:NADH-quinone oxidoreductase subunit J